MSSHEPSGLRYSTRSSPKVPYVLDHSPCSGFVRAHRTGQLVRQRASGSYLRSLETDIRLSVNWPDDIIATHLIDLAALRTRTSAGSTARPGSGRIPCSVDESVGVVLPTGPHCSFPDLAVFHSSRKLNRLVHTIAVTEIE